MAFYFAYGRDMDRAELNKRLREVGIPEVVICQPATLHGNRLAFNTKVKDSRDAGYANIVLDSTKKVHGVLYDLLDVPVERLAGYNPGYDPEGVTVEREDGSRQEATAFRAKPAEVDDARMPTREYLEYLKRAASPLPITYVAVLDSWPKVRSSDEPFDEAEIFGRLSPASRESLARADRLRQGQARVHMEHLIRGLFAEPNGPTQSVLAAKIIDAAELSVLLQAAAEKPTEEAS